MLDSEQAYLLSCRTTCAAKVCQLASFAGCSSKVFRSADRCVALPWCVVWLSGLEASRESCKGASKLLAVCAGEDAASV